VSYCAYCSVAGRHSYRKRRARRCPCWSCIPSRPVECEFDSPLVVEGPHLNELSVTGCARLPGLLANGVRIGRDLDLSRSHVSGTHWTSASNTHGAAVWLCESDISGRLLCAETTISADGGRAVQADRMRTGGAAASSRAGATQAVMPPGRKGVPTSIRHSTAIRATRTGSSASQWSRPSPSRPRKVIGGSGAMEKRKPSTISA
jgi:hypothetical protein